MTGRSFLAIVAALFAVSSASAQVVIRAPFVRVETGGPGGTYVRAPFVSIFSPPPFYYGPPPVIFGPPPAFPVAPPQVVQPPVVAVPKVPQPLPMGPDAEPRNDPDFAPPAPAQVPGAPSLAEFAKSFKPKAGNYEITLTNPVNQQQETVKFSLPGEPRQVRTGRNHVEFVYGPRNYVRIEFDRDGPIVITR